MNRLLLPILGLVIALFGGAYWLSNQMCGAAAAPVSSATTMSIMDGDFKSTIDAGLHFNASGSQLNGGQNAQASFAALAEHLKSNPDKQLTITGNYATSENNDSQFDNLGLGRADAFKSVLTGLGVNADQIALAANEQNSIQLADGDKIYNGVNFNFGAMVVEPEGPVVDPTSEGFKPLNLRFPTGQFQLSLTPEIKAYFDGLKAYMDANPGSKVAVTGHTDNKGSLNGNLTLSRRRARRVAEFMYDNGFTKNQIVQGYEGPRQPIATNDTEEGREKNRRVEIRIQ
ncbi:MAG: OmpA family protein [Bacteroidota bacterium]